MFAASTYHTRGPITYRLDALGDEICKHHGLAATVVARNGVTPPSRLNHQHNAIEVRLIPAEPVNPAKVQKVLLDMAIACGQEMAKDYTHSHELFCVAELDKSGKVNTTLSGQALMLAKL